MNILNNHYEVDLLVHSKDIFGTSIYHGEVTIKDPLENGNYTIVGSGETLYGDDRVSLSAKNELHFYDDQFITCNVDLVFEHYNHDTKQLESTKSVNKDFILATPGQDQLSLIDKSILLSKDSVIPDTNNLITIGVHDAGELIDAVKTYKKSD